MRTLAAMMILGDGGISSGTVLNRALFPQSPTRAAVISLDASGGRSTLKLLMAALQACLSKVIFSMISLKYLLTGTLPGSSDGGSNVSGVSVQLNGKEGDCAAKSSKCCRDDSSASAVVGSISGDALGSLQSSASA